MNLFMQRAWTEEGHQLRVWKAALSPLRSPVKLGLFQRYIALKQRSSDIFDPFCKITLKNYGHLFKLTSKLFPCCLK